jgi:hypothetical protein
MKQFIIFSFIMLQLNFVLFAQSSTNITLRQMLGVNLNPAQGAIGASSFQNQRSFHLWADDIGLGIEGGGDRLSFR